LRAAAGHPHMQGKHVVMLTGEDLVTDLDDQIVAFVVESLSSMVCVSSSFLQNRVRGDHFPRHEVLANAEVFKGTLGLRPPKLVDENLDLAKAIRFGAVFSHMRLPV